MQLPFSEAGTAWSLGIDSGGTFTDQVAIDSTTGRIRTLKVPSTPSDPVAAVSDCLDRFRENSISRLVHGTTVATNAVLERQGAELCLITTGGFEDVVFIQRINRERAYNLQGMKPTPLVLRRHCLGVDERLGADGALIRALTEEAIRDLMDRLTPLVVSSAVDAVAICLLYSYLDDAHEIELASRITERFPSLPLSLSSVVSPVWREYERASTVLTDAYVKPLMSGYFDALDLATAVRIDDAPLSILKSNGGTGSISAVRPRPVSVILSGLAGGVVGGAHFAAAEGAAKAITFDMGGTSSDVGLIDDGQVGFVNEYEIEWGLPVVIPVVDVHTIGAGGGSIARVDKGGLLQVGPESAGAVPGPACYGLGGTAATVTDANLALDRLNPDYFLGGRLRLDRESARDAIEAISHDLNMSPTEAAESIIAVADENMANAIRLITIERGIDPRDFALVAFGGAGPLHACGVAGAVGIRKIIIPPNPGLCSAFGAAIARLRVNRTWSVADLLDRVDEVALRHRIVKETHDASDEMERDGASEHVVEVLASCRYYLQNHEQLVTIPSDMHPGFLSAVRTEFDRIHETTYGYAFESDPVEIVHCTVIITQKPNELDYITLVASEEERLGEPTTRRIVLDGEETSITIVDRRGVESIAGPAIIEEPTSTILVRDGWRASVSKHGTIVMEGQE